jgi:chromosome segregation ATPase
VVTDPAGSLAHAAELERRDEAVAARLEGVRALAGRTGSLRERAAATRSALDILPRELDELAGRIAAGEAAAARARDELADAERRLAAVEGRRRRRDDELERARSEVETARQQLLDAERELDRLTTLRSSLRADLADRERERTALLAAAADVARELRAVPQLADPALAEPGGTLASLEEWGARARAALFVAQGTLETERERIVLEANALGTAVLGESLGGSSVSVIRRRVEERLG